jgi:hypothetical protein
MQSGLSEGHDVSRGKVLPTFRRRALPSFVESSSPKRMQFLRNVGGYLAVDTT